jgi:hypothetical protein
MQGSVYGTLLYCLVNDVFIARLEKLPTGIFLPQTKTWLSSTAFMDDMQLFSSSQQAAQELTDSYCLSLQLARMDINAKKTVARCRMKTLDAERQQHVLVRHGAATQIVHF